MTVPAVYPIHQEHVYERALLDVVEEVGRLSAAIMLPAFRQAAEEFAAEMAPRARRDRSWPSTITAAVAHLRLKAADTWKAGLRTARTIGEEMREVGSIEFSRALTGVQALRRETWLRPLMQSWVEENSRLIQSIASQYIDQVAQRTQDMVRSGAGLRDYVSELSRAYGVTQKRASLIARTEVAKLNGQITRARQMRAGLTEYEWMTSADERVRDSHRVLNGMICDWSDPTVFREPGSALWRRRSEIGAFIGIPGGAVNCRCTAGARVDDFLNNLLGEAA